MQKNSLMNLQDVCGSDSNCNNSCWFIICVWLIESSISVYFHLFSLLKCFAFPSCIGFDLQVPIDSMQGLDLGGQVGHGGYGTLGTDMDLDSPPDINFDTLEPMLPSPPQDADATQMAAWYDTDV